MLSNRHIERVLGTNNFIKTIKKNVKGHRFYEVLQCYVLNFINALIFFVSFCIRLTKQTKDQRMSPWSLGKQILRSNNAELVIIYDYAWQPTVRTLLFLVSFGLYSLMQLLSSPTDITCSCLFGFVITSCSAISVFTHSHISMFTSVHYLVVWSTLYRSTTVLWISRCSCRHMFTHPPNSCDSVVTYSRDATRR